MVSKDVIKRGGLGKGLRSLLGDDDDRGAVGVQSISNDLIEPSGSKETNRNRGDVGGDLQQSREIAATHFPATSILELGIDQIDPNPAQPRKTFAEDKIEELAASIRVDGILQPLLVTRPKGGSSRYILVAGERRFRAAKKAGLTKVPVVVKEGIDDDLLRLALIENIQRADLNIIEEAEALRALMDEGGLTQEQCADRVGKDRSTIANTLRLLALPIEVREDLAQGLMTMGHGRALLSLSNPQLILKARDLVLKRHLSVRQTEQLCKSYIDPEDSRSGASGIGPAEDEADLEYLAETLRMYLKTKVRLNGSAQRGRIEISYFSPSELERILELLGQKFG